jgi:hypothetical protein
MTATAELPPTGVAPAPPVAAKPEKVRDKHYLALRNFAISISVFNVFGYVFLGFEQPWLWPIFSILVGYATETVFELISAWAYKRKPGMVGKSVKMTLAFYFPAHITSLAVNMLLYANDQYWPVAFGVIVAVSGKHVLRAPVYGKMRHFMNPSNLGITAALVCFGSWVSIAPPYEFTENANTFFRVMLPLIIVTAGTVINATLTGKVPLIVGWMGGFAIQAFVRHWIWDVALYTALGVMTGVAFVLFTNYMITDPGTTPKTARNQFMFGASLALIYAVLLVYNVVYTLFFAVVIVCGIRGIGWWVAHFISKSRAATAATTIASVDSISAQTPKAA